MVEVNEAIGVALLAGVVGAIGVRLLCALLYPRLRHFLRRAGPEFRGILIMGLLVLPLATGLAFVGVILSPALEYGPLAHHCHAADIAGCVPHSLHSFGQALSAATILSIAGLMVWPFVRAAGPLRRLKRAAEGLRRAGTDDAHYGAVIVDDPRPLAFSLGLLTPRVFISEGLKSRLREDELAAVIHHEKGHAQRRDGFWQLIGEVLSIGHSRQTTKLLLNDLNLAAEETCDRYAAQKAGGPLNVAATILKIERLYGDHPPLAPAGAYGMTGSSVPARVEALIAAREERDGEIAVTALAGGAGLALAVFMTAEPLHHLIESLFNIVLG